jgi:hypothetical protein
MARNMALLLVFSPSPEEVRVRAENTGIVSEQQI